jgi:hypothetical protein
MSDELSERVEALEREAKRLRRWALVLAAALVGVVAIGASGPQELTLRKLTIVDAEGNARMVASAGPGGEPAGLVYYDSNKKQRIMTGTGAPGQPAVTVYYDSNDKQRIVTGTGAPGQPAGTVYFDGKGKERIMTSTFRDGSAEIKVIDSSGSRTWAKSSK